jgi:hypothetical protein
MNIKEFFTKRFKQLNRKTRKIKMWVVHLGHFGTGAGVAALLTKYFGGASLPLDFLIAFLSGLAVVFIHEGIINGAFKKIRNKTVTTDELRDYVFDSYQILGGALFFGLAFPIDWFFFAGWFIFYFVTIFEQEG